MQPRGYFVIIDIANLRVKSPNTRAGHWKGHFFGYVKPVRERVRLSVMSRLAFERKTFRPPMEILLYRVAPKTLDFDNLVAGMKPVRDGVTDGLGLKDDNESKGLSWIYGQMRGMPGEYGVKIELRRVPESFKG